MMGVVREQPSAASIGDPVRELVIPPAVPPTTRGNLADLPARNARETPDKAAFSVRRESA